MSMITVIYLVLFSLYFIIIFYFLWMYQRYVYTIMITKTLVSFGHPVSFGLPQVHNFVVKALVGE